jgi:hypothetical protein
MDFISVQFFSVDLSTEMISVTRQSPYFRRTQIYHGKISTNHGNNSNSSSVANEHNQMILYLFLNLTWDGSKR